MLLLSRPRGARVLALAGALGAGKTTFVQGLARSLGAKDTVRSPTFILMQPFNVRVPQSKRVLFSRVWHIDCYRIESPKELQILGLDAILKDPRNLVVIEWADKIESLLPKDTVWVKFEHGKRENERIITLKAKGKTKKEKQQGKRQN